MTEWDRMINQFTQANKCMFAVQEGPHRVACGDEATERSNDNLPACEEHSNFRLRDRWKGYVRGLATLALFVFILPVLGFSQQPASYLYAIQVTSHTNLPTATRLNLGGGLVIIDQISWMPRLEAKVVGVKALCDIHGLNGVKASITSYHNFSASPFGIFGEVTSAYSRFHDVGVSRTRGAFSGEIRVGFFVNLSAIKGV